MAMFIDGLSDFGFQFLEPQPDTNLGVGTYAVTSKFALGEFSTVRVQGERNHGSLESLLGHLSTLEARGACRFAEQTASLRGDGALLFFLSDFWDEDLRAPVQHAAGHGEAGMLHVLSAEEADPRMEGRFRFVDSESGETVSRFVNVRSPVGESATTRLAL